jgi:hypothetical protein
MLLERCREVHEYADRYDRVPVDAAGLLDWARHWLRVHELGQLLRPITAIRAAVANDLTELTLPDFDPTPTALMHRVLHVGRGPATWEIDELFVDVLRVRDV